MNRLYRPYLLLITVTLPQIIIFTIFSKIFHIINSELLQEDINMWIILGTYLGISCMGFTIYSIVGWIRKKDIHPLAAIIMFISYIIFLTIYFFRYNNVIPSSVANWMLLGVRPGITMLTLIMPALAQSMLIIVHSTMKKSKVNIPKDFLFLVGVPAFWYIIIQLTFILNIDGIDGFEKIMPIIFIISAITFFFFFVRIILSVLKLKSQIWKKYLAVLVFLGSLMGLTLNQSFGNIMGDFSHYNFYILNIITGILMLIPEIDNRRIRLLLFIAKSITLVFTFYFFIVFLPYLPLSLVGIIVVGLGILMLVPLALMFLHIRQLWDDFNYLKLFYSKGVLLVLFLIGILLIPTAYGITISNDKENLDTALRYIYQRGFEDDTEANLNLPGIKRALTNIKHVKGINRNRFDVFSNGTPYLTSFYNWHVLDNLSISSEKIRNLEELFFGESDIGVSRRNNFVMQLNEDKDVYIKNIRSETKYDSKSKSFKSWVDLKVKNKTNFQNEYHTTFKLPEGSYISNYYLYVENEKKYGLIADKRAANWVYDQVKSIRRDPGLLTYFGDNNIDFKVFPFSANETRKTGIEIVHRKPIELNIDGKLIELKGDNNVTDALETIDLDQGVIYIPQSIKETLPKITRENEYYFIMDYSKGNERNIDDYKKRVSKYISENNLENSVKEIIALNFEEKRISYNNKWEESTQNFKVEGGFHLEYTIKNILYDKYVKSSDKRPIIIVVTDDKMGLVMQDDLNSFSFTAPEGVSYYNLGGNEKLIKYSLDKLSNNFIENEVEMIHKSPVFEYKTKEGKTFYLPDNKEDSILFVDHINHKPGFNNDDLENSKWQNGALLKAMYMNYMLHPENYFENSLSIVKGSIKKEVMSPLTSFIVLENEAQEKAMLEKQKEILSTEKPIDIGDMTTMDEPSILLIGFVVLGVIVLKKKKERRNTSN